MFHTPISTRLLIGLLFLSTICVIISTVLITYIVPLVINKGVDANSRLEPDTVQFEHFVDLPFPINLKIYIFNVENPNEVLAGKKPRVRQVGPYIYKEYRKKYIISTDEENDTLTYTESQKYFFDPEASKNLSDSDNVTVINPLYLGMLQTVEAISGSLVDLFNRCLPGILGEYNTPFVTVSVKELFFTGMNFCIKDHNTSPACSIEKNIICSMAKGKKNTDRKITDGSLLFSFLNYKNQTPQGPFTINRGIKQVENVGKLIKVNNSQNISVWQEGTSCSKVGGLSGTSFPPRISKKFEFSIFSNDFCRNFNLVFERKGSVNGIDGFMFTTRNDTFYAKNEDPKGDCFCSNLTKGLYGQKFCYLDGVMDNQPCAGAPNVLSFPHFLYAEHYTDFILGLKPNKSCHKTYLLIEPNTGTPLYSSSRVQLNVVLRPVKGVKAMQRVQRVLFPVFWVDENMEVPEDLLTILKEKYFDTVRFVNVAEWSFLGVSLGLTLAFGVWLLTKFMVQ